MSTNLLAFMAILMLISGLQPVLIKGSECGVLEKTKPTHYITYEARIGKSVRLKLHNNADCAIVVEIDSRPLGRLVKLPNGTIKAEEIQSAVDGLNVPLHYLLKSQKLALAERPAYSWGDSVATYEIPGGSSVDFLVPLKHFSERHAVVVPFNYSWEKQPAVARGIGGVQHSVGFLIEQLPPGLLRRR